MEPKAVRVSKFVAPLALIAFGLTAFAGSCEHKDPYACVDPSKVPGGAPVTSSNGENIGVIQQPLYVKTRNVWDRVAIPVCWDSGSWASTKDSDRDIVKKAIGETWELALAFDIVPKEKQVHFTGWTECNSSNNDGIRIKATHGEDSAPHTNALGDSLAGDKGGMVLEFDFTKWSPVCASPESSRKFCIYAIAVHEFGHALGFAHEQNRPDTDKKTCTDAPQGTDGDLLVGAWDNESVMNYCNPDWNNGGQLSDGDEMGVRAAYYPSYFDFQCVGEYKQHNPVVKPSP